MKFKINILLVFVLVTYTRPSDITQTPPKRNVILRISPE